MKWLREPARRTSSLSNAEDQARLAGTQGALTSDQSSASAGSVSASVTAILRGFDYQARWFWIEALRLFRADPVLQRVVIEGCERRPAGS